MQTVGRVTLSEAVIPQRGVLRDVTLVVGFSLIVALSAQIAFYIGPVPITMQTFAVLLTGASLGSRRAGLSMLLYLGEGAAGLPVFAGGHSGIPYMLGFTGGYLMGFVVAAFVVGLLAERGWDRRFWTTAAAMLIGNVIIYLFGLSWLAHFPLSKPLLWVGLIPFMPGEMLKMTLAAGALPSAWAILQKVRS